jgi:hypothetical protein
VPFSRRSDAHKKSVGQVVAELFKAEPPGETYVVKSDFVNKVLARCKFHQSSHANLKTHIRSLDIVPPAPPKKPRAAPVPAPARTTRSTPAEEKKTRSALHAFVCG